MKSKNPLVGMSNAFDWTKARSISHLNLQLIFERKEFEEYSPTDTHLSKME